MAWRRHSGSVKRNHLLDINNLTPCHSFKKCCPFIIKMFVALPAHCSRRADESTKYLHGKSRAFHTLRPLKQPQNNKLVISIRSQSGKAGIGAAVMVPYNFTVCKRPIKHCPRVNQVWRIHFTAGAGKEFANRDANHRSINSPTLPVRHVHRPIPC